jgi:hypothetical protein
MSGRLGIYSQAAGGGAPFAFGNALEFDGVNDYVSSALSSYTQTNDITLSFWIKEDTPSSFNAIMTIPMSGGQPLTLLYDSGGSYGQFTFGVRGLSSNRVSSGITKTNWNHILLSGKPSIGLSCYINGVLISTVATGALGVYANNFDLGRYGGSYGNVMLDEVAVLGGTAATLTNAQNLYNSGNGADFNSVMGSSDVYYHLDESGTATTAVDSSGNGNDGTLNNFATSGMWVAH